jgi:hypothetical protein
MQDLEEKKNEKWTDGLGRITAVGAFFPMHVFDCEDVIKAW